MPDLKQIAMGVLLLAIAGVAWVISGGPKKDLVASGDLSIAIVGPMSGAAERIGKEMVVAAEVLVAEINAKGGIGGKGETVGLKIFDDANDPERAASVASEIAQDPTIVAVVGHALSSTSLAAAPVYEAARLPAVSPSATTPALTEDHPNYFSVIYSDRTQGRFMADYAHQGMNAKSAILLVSPGPYPEALAQSFMDRAPISGVEIRNALVVPMNALRTAAGAQGLLDAISSDLSDDTLIVLMAERAPAADIVRALRDLGVKQRLLGPDALGTSRFASMFNELPSEIAKPGFYTSNLFVSVPFIADTANAKAHRLLSKMEKEIGRIDSWIAPFAHDATLLILEALKRSNQLDNVAAARAAVADRLIAMSQPDQAVDGATGHIQLDANGAAVRPVVIGLFSGGLVSSLVQLQIDSTDPQAAPRRTAIVYSGIKPTGLSEIDLIAGEADVHFDIWFRYQGELDPSNIEFDNAVSPVILSEPVQMREWNGINYVRYAASGTFLLNYSETPAGFADHVVSIAFHHREKSRTELVFVADGIGLASTRGADYALSINDGLKEAGGWKFKQASLASRLTPVDSRGDPLFLSGSGQEFQQAGLLFAGVAGPKSVGFRHLFDSEITWVIALLFVGMLIAFRMLESRSPLAGKPRAGFLVYLLLSTVTLALVEVSVLRVAGGMEGRPIVGPLLVIFDALWWFGPALLLCMALNRFVWSPLERKTGQSVPGIIKNFVVFLVFAFASFGVIAFVFNQQVTSLLATSGVLAMIIGLAIQMNISNIFSGIALNVERPFRPGDWVRIGDALGKVKDVSWRSIKMETFQNTVISIPNATASESHIENYSYPNDNYRIFQILHFGLEHSPERVTRLLYDALHLVVPVDGRKRLGLTWVKYNGVDEHGQKFLVAFDCTDRMLKNSQEHVVLISIYRVLAQSGIHPSTSHLDLHVRPAQIDLGEAALTPERLIESVPIFAPLGEQGRARLCDLVERRTFAAGEAVVREGEDGDSMFLVAEGVVAIEVSAEGQDEPMEVARLGPGEFFGEMALLTGDPRAATVVARDTTLIYEVTKAAIAPLMEGGQSLGVELSDVLAERQLKTASEREANRSYEEVKAEISKGLFGRIQSFFGKAPTTADKRTPTREAAPSVRDHGGNGSGAAPSEPGSGVDTPGKPVAAAEAGSNADAPCRPAAPVESKAKARTARKSAPPAEPKAKARTAPKSAPPAGSGTKAPTTRKRAAPAEPKAKVETPRKRAASAQPDAAATLRPTGSASPAAEAQENAETTFGKCSVAGLRSDAKANGNTRTGQLNLSEVDQNEVTSSND